MKKNCTKREKVRNSVINTPKPGSSTKSYKTVTVITLSQSSTY